MKNYFVLIATLGIILKVDGQSLPVKYFLTLDTILLKEVTFFYTVPLNNGKIERFYRTNSFSTIDNLVEHLEGVSLIKRGAYAMEPQLNGFSGGQINITIDGMKMFGACTDKMDPVTSYLEPGNLKNITLEHGTNGGLHGNSTGGSIDLALQEPTTSGNKPFNSSISLGYESVSNSRNLLVSTGYAKHKWAWGLNGIYRVNDSYRAGSGRTINHSQFEKYNLHSVLKYSMNDYSAFRTDVLWDLASNVGYPALPMDVGKARAVIFAAEYQRTKRDFNLKSKIYFNSIYHVMDDSKRDSLFFITDSRGSKTDSVIMRMEMPGWSKTFGSYFQAEFDLNKRNTLTIKADNYVNSSLAEMTMHMHFAGKPPEPSMYLQTWPDLLRTVSGLYLSNTTEFTRNFTFTLNGRFDYNIDQVQSAFARDQFSVFGKPLASKYFQFTKGLNTTTRWILFKPLVLSLQTGFSERIPTISERFGFYLYNAYDGYDYIGNPFLKTEKSVSARLQVTYIQGNLKFNLAQSFSVLNDYIMGETDTIIPPMNFYTNGLREFKNTDGVKLSSTDLQIMMKSEFGLSIFILTRYARGRLNSTTPLPMIPPLKNTLSVSYEKKRWSFQADNETAFKQNQINKSYGENKTPAYTLFNIKANFHFMVRELMLDCSAGITNLLNSNYYEHPDWGHIPRQGRSLNFFFKYTF